MQAEYMTSWKVRSNRHNQKRCEDFLAISLTVIVVCRVAHNHFQGLPQTDCDHPSQMKPHATL